MVNKSNYYKLYFQNLKLEFLSRLEQALEADHDTRSNGVEMILLEIFVRFVSGGGVRCVEGLCQFVQLSCDRCRDTVGLHLLVHLFQSVVDVGQCTGIIGD